MEKLRKERESWGKGARGETGIVPRLPPGPTADLGQYRGAILCRWSVGLHAAAFKDRILLGVGDAQIPSG